MSATTTLDAYIRVSSVRGRSGESFISPDTQKDRIEAWAKSQDYEIAKVWDERDESGGTVDRPMLNEVMERIEAGETGGVVVFKLDRFGRTLIDSLALIERIREAGGTFASVNDGFDLSTETGRLVLRVMLSLAEYELERIRANWREARERAVARGHHLTPTVPFGFQRRSDTDNRLAPHPVSGPIVTGILSGGRPARTGRICAGGSRAQARAPSEAAACGRSAHCATSSATTSTSGSRRTASFGARRHTSR